MGPSGCGKSSLLRAIDYGMLETARSFVLNQTKSYFAATSLFWGRYAINLILTPMLRLKTST